LAPTGSIVLASGNTGKLREIRRELSGLPVRVASLEEFGSIPEPEEHGETFGANARDKALYYAEATGQWCLADDSGLAVDALDGAPGVRSARYAADDVGPDADRPARDAANNARLLAALAGVPDDRRTAWFICHVALAEPGRVLIEATDSVEGVILREGRGSNGFGYDPLFFLPETGRTAAELTAEEKNRISHRGKAVRQFADKLRELLER
jgi:XTP/dITP diphosphohydrolase